MTGILLHYIKELILTYIGMSLPTINEDCVDFHGQSDDPSLLVTNPDTGITPDLKSKLDSVKAKLTSSPHMS